MGFEYAIEILEDMKENLSKIRNMDGVNVYGENINKLQEAINLLQSQAEVSK